MLQRNTWKDLWDSWTGCHQTPLRFSCTIFVYLCISNLWGNKTWPVWITLCSESSGLRRMTFTCPQLVLFCQLILFGSLGVWTTGASGTSSSTWVDSCRKSACHMSCFGSAYACSIKTLTCCQRSFLADTQNVVYRKILSVFPWPMNSDESPVSAIVVFKNVHLQYFAIAFQQT